MVTGLERIAVHEAGHAVAAVFFGRRVRFLRATTNDAGVASCHYEPPPATDEDRPRLVGAAFSLPTAFRQAMEYSLVVTMAAEQAERFWKPDQGVTYRGPDPSEKAEWRARARAGLPTPEARELLEEDDEREGYVSDADREIAMAVTIAGKTSGPYLHWLRAEAIELVLSEHFQRALRPLALTLLERGELAGEEVHAIVEEALAAAPPPPIYGPHVVEAVAA